MVKITFKTLKQEIFALDFDESTTIADVKAKIEAEKSFAVSAQKLIYNGRILADDRTVESCELKENSFIVVMVSKPPKPATQAPSVSSALATPSKPPSDTLQTPQTENVPSTPANQITSTSTTAPDAPAAAITQTVEPLVFGNTTSFIGGAQLTSTIANMMEMGYSNEECTKAMRAAFNNPDRAVEYLLTGIPSHLNEPAAAPVMTAPVEAGTPATPTPANTSGAVARSTTNQTSQDAGNLFEAAAAAAAATSTEDGPDMSSFSSPEGAAELRRLVQMVQHNPELLEPFLEQLHNTNPALANQIAAHPDMFLRFLSDGDDQDGGERMQESEDGVQYIDISPEEEESINRLVALGFEKDKCVQAYIACDKNEELAANYLFSIMDEE